MTWDKDDPRWKIAQGVITLLTLAIWVWHVHHGGADLEDASGALGAGMGAKLVYQFVKRS
jgi:hypothetical protein